MACDACEKMQSEGGGAYPYRIGNKEIGYATILIIACEKHAKLTIDTLNVNAETSGRE